MLLFAGLYFSAITCDSLTVPTNGDLIYNTDNTPPHDFGTIVSYQCDSGYGLTTYGPSITTNPRTCVGTSSSVSGVWNGLDLGCERKQIKC